MTVIEKLKEAIINKRWDIIEEVYEDFGGNLSDISLNTKRTLVTDIDLGPSTFVEKPKATSNSSDDFLSPIKNPNSKSIGGKTGRFDAYGNEIILSSSEPIDISKSKINLYEDDLTDARSDIEFDRKVIVKKPVVRQQRKDAVEIPAICKSCEKQFMVLPQFAAHYRCDKCMIPRR